MVNKQTTQKQPKYFENYFMLRIVVIYELLLSFGENVEPKKIECSFLGLKNCFGVEIPWNR